MNKGKENSIPFELLSKYLAEEATQDETIQVNAWINSTAENKREFERLQKLWKSSTNYNPKDIDVEQALNKVNQKINQQKGNEKGNSKTILRLVASVALLIGAAWLFFFLSKPNIQEVVVSSHQDTLSHTLPDGSVITLNENSSITYKSDFAEKNRDVALKGEAFFEVTKDKQKPFIIRTKTAQVKVLGTSFNVDATNEKEKVQVTVSTGLVSLHPINLQAKVLLNPGEQGELKVGSGVLKKKKVIDGVSDFWRTKTLIFKKTELKEVATILSKLYNVNIVVESTEVSNCKLSTTFNNQSIDSILEVIARTFNLNIKKKNKEFLLQGNGC